MSTEDILISYNNSEITTLDYTDIITLKTKNKKCSGNIIIQYNKPSKGINFENELLSNWSISSYDNSIITTIGRSAFAYCGLLSTINMPAVTEISANGFTGCF